MKKKLKQNAVSLLGLALAGGTLAMVVTQTYQSADMVQGASQAAVIHSANNTAKPDDNIDPIAVMETYCYSCHGPDEQKGTVRFDKLETVDPVKLQELFGNSKEVLEFEDMPPAKAKQPSAAERAALIHWLDGKISPEEKKKLADKLKKPEYGNYVDHEALFSGEHADLPAYTTDRRWLISEFIFDAKMQRILENRVVASVSKKKRADVLGGHVIQGLSIANPFLLPEKTGVRYYANDDLTRGHLSTMLGNAHKTALYITETKVSSGRNRKYLPAVQEVLAIENQHAATLASRRAFLEQDIAQVCEELYGEENALLLPEFEPIKLKERKQYTAEELKKNRRLPVHVSINTLKKSGGWEPLVQIVLDPANQDKADQEIMTLAERFWFYRGDYERDVLSRLSILRDYMADVRESITKDRREKLRTYKPLDDAEMKAITAAIRKHRDKGDRYSDVLEKCMDDWEEQFKQDRIDAGSPSDELYARLIDQLFVQILERSPETQEADEYLSLIKGYTDKLGRRKATQKLIQTLVLTSEFAYRQEYGVGEPDEHGRRMLPPRDAAYAIAYALTDQSPDEALVTAAREGRLSTRADYEREVRRLLARRDINTLIDPILEDRNWSENHSRLPIRELRFFREFFGYPKALEIFKDEKRFGGDRLAQSTNRLVSEADRLVEYILEQDERVFEELIGTEEFYVYHDGDNERMRELSEHIKSIYAYFKDKDWENFTKEDLAKHEEFMKEIKMRHVDTDNLDKRFGSGTSMSHFKRSMTSITARLDKGQKHAAPYDLSRGYGSQFMPGGNVAKFWGISKSNWHWSPEQPMKIANRKGMLTHPAWLVAHAFNTETD
ncbi:MAG: DUF1592 domain-containing protein, partial [Phycisphaeraceae bacterium]